MTKQYICACCVPTIVCVLSVSKTWLCGVLFLFGMQKTRIELRRCPCLSWQQRLADQIEQMLLCMPSALCCLVACYADRQETRSFLCSVLDGHITSAGLDAKGQVWFLGQNTIKFMNPDRPGPYIYTRLEMEMEVFSNESAIAFGPRYGLCVWRKDAQTLLFRFLPPDTRRQKSGSGSVTLPRDVVAEKRLSLHLRVLPDNNTFLFGWKGGKDGHVLYMVESGAHNNNNERTPVNARRVRRRFLGQMVHEWEQAPNENVMRFCEKCEEWNCYDCTRECWHFARAKNLECQMRVLQ